MEGFFANLLKVLPTAATSPYALAAYALAVVAYLILGWRVVRHRELLRHLSKLPKEQRLRALQTEMSEILPESVTFEQWMRLRKQRYVFWGCLVAGLTLVALVAVAAFAMDRGKVSMPVALSDHDQQFMAQLRASPWTVRLSTFSYEQAKLPNGHLQIGPAAEYLDAIKDGLILPSTANIGRRSWWYPTLSIQTVNNSRRTVQLSQLRIDVKASELDNEPIPIVMGGERGEIYLRNEGWGEIVDATADVKLYDLEACPRERWDGSSSEISKLPAVAPWASFESKFENGRYFSSIDTLKFIPSAKQFELVSCENYAEDICNRTSHVCAGLHEGEVRCLDTRKSLTEVMQGTRCLQFDEKATLAAARKRWKGASLLTSNDFELRATCRAKSICAYGTLTYLAGKTSKKLNFATTIELRTEPTTGAGSGPDRTYDMFLRAGAAPRTYDRTISQKVKPGDTDHFLVQLSSDRSADFQLDISVVDTEGRVVGSSTVALKMLILRSAEGEALYERCREGRQNDQPQECEKLRRRSESRSAANASSQGGSGGR